MVLSMQEEERIIEKYDKVIWSTVHRFKRRMTIQHDNKDDLHQEAVMVMLKHIRTCNTQDEISKIPIRDMINAMCRHVLGEQVVSVPKRTTTFSKTISTVAKASDYSELTIDDKYCDMSIDDVMTKVIFDAFCCHLSDAERRIVDLKMNGYSNREISRMIGVTDVYITRALKKIKTIYLKCTA